MSKKISILIVLCLVVVIIFPLNSATAKDDKLVVVGWGGAWEKAARKAFGEPFEKETGIKIIWTAPLDFGKLKAMVEAGRPEWDVIAAAGMHWMVRAEYAGLLDRIDYKIVDTYTDPPGTSEQ